jgi:hypothetical protein
MTRGPGVTDEPAPVPEQEPDEETSRRENKGSAEQPWHKDEQPYADRPEQGDGSGLRQ